METAGWVILGEIRYYETREIFGILGSSLLVCIGIYILTIKKGFVAHIKKKNDSGDSENDENSFESSQIGSLQYEIDLEPTDFTGDEEDI